MATEQNKKARIEEIEELESLYKYGSSYKVRLFDFMIDLALDQLITYDEAVSAYLSELEQDGIEP